MEFGDFSESFEVEKKIKIHLNHQIPQKTLRIRVMNFFGVYG